MYRCTVVSGKLAALAISRLVGFNPLQHSRINARCTRRNLVWLGLFMLYHGQDHEPQFLASSAG